jgi:hypothetical protein
MDAHNYPLDDIFQVCRRLNGPLPVYHPQFLEQAILSGNSKKNLSHRDLGKLGLVKSLLKKLEDALNNQGHQLPKEIEISTFLGTPISDFLSNTDVLLPISSNAR